MFIQVVPPPVPPPPPPGLSIDSGVIVLLFVAVVYGVLTIFKSSKNYNFKTTYKVITKKMPKPV